MVKLIVIWGRLNTRLRFRFEMSTRTNDLTFIAVPPFRREQYRRPTQI